MCYCGHIEDTVIMAITELLSSGKNILRRRRFVLLLLTLGMSVLSFWTPSLYQLYVVSKTMATKHHLYSHLVLTADSTV